MGFVQYYGTVASEIVVVHCFAEQHAVRHILQDGLLARNVLKSDTVAHFFAYGDIHFIGNSFGNRHSCYSTRLSTCDKLTIDVGQVVKEDELGDLRRLS